jgi:hypothetical protein
MPAVDVVFFEEAREVAVAKKREFRSKAVEFAYERYASENPKVAAAFEEELSSADIAFITSGSEQDLARGSLRQSWAQQRQ